MINEIEYALISVEKTDPPNGEEGGSWYQYIVGRGNSSLVGKRRGTLKQVKEHAETLAPRGAALKNRPPHVCHGTISACDWVK